jgi:hypothetical protein
MQSYEESMAVGSAGYKDVLAQLAKANLSACFVHTGGMNAALQIVLDGRYSLLVTDVEESLSWDRPDHNGWAVGLYPPESEYDGETVAYASCEDGSLSALLLLVRFVLSAARGVR